MATYLRRKLNKFMEKDETPVVLTLQVGEGAVTLNKREVQRYAMLFSMLDSDKDDSIGGQEGASFLRRSGLDTDALREIWRLASGGTSKPRLGREDFFVACKLISATQEYGRPDMQFLYRGEALDLADFHYDLNADVSVAGTSDDSQDIKVSVGNPTTFGSGLDKHTKYQVSTLTSLTQFSRKEMSVWRRFSDFNWLHMRMSTCFPAAILPLFPTKKLLGNNDGSFTRERAQALETYLDKLAHHPALNNSLDLIVFLDASDEGLEAAKRYIEEKGSEEAESMLSKGVDMMMNMATTGNAAPPLVIKADEEFVQSCASHGAALARLNSAVKTSMAVDYAQQVACDTSTEAGRSLLAIAEHERKAEGLTTTTRGQVLEAASAAKRAEAGLLGPGAAVFAGQAGSPSSAADAAAAAAFNAHSAAASKPDGSISGMFSADFSDPYAAFGGTAFGGVTGAAAGAGAGAGRPVGSPASLPDICESVGHELISMGARWREQVKELDGSLYTGLRNERDREAELGEAIKRRDGAIDKVQDSNGALARRKKAYQAIKPSDKDYSRKSAEASAAVEKAEQALAARRDELDKMTELLKGEMDRVQRVRRAQLVIKLNQFARAQADHARARAEAWQALLPSVTLDVAAAEASKEYVSAIARKAEAKARAASQSAKAKAGVVATSAALAVGDSGEASSGGMFSDEAPIPSAADL